MDNYRGRILIKCNHPVGFRGLCRLSSIPPLSIIQARLLPHECLNTLTTRAKNPWPLTHHTAIGVSARAAAEYDEQALMLAKLIKPFHFKVFFSNKYVNAQVLDKVTNAAVASISSSNRLFEDYRVKNDEAACELAARILAAKVREKEVPSIYWDGIIAQKSNRRKWHAQADKMWETFESEGLSTFRDVPPTQQERDARRRKGPAKESRIDPRFRQQMWKLIKKRPRRQASKPAPVDPRPEI